MQLASSLFTVADMITYLKVLLLLIIIQPDEIILAI